MSKVKLTDYVVEFLQKKGIHDFFGYQGTMIAHLVDPLRRIPMQEVIPAIMSRELLLPPAVMLRQRMPAAVPMLPVVRELPICFLVWQMRISILFR